MAANRWKVTLIAFGGVIVILMLVAASFSLGVYVGEHGWTRSGLQYTAGPGPAGQPQRGDQPSQDGARQPPFQSGGQPGGLPPGRPDVNGRIRQIAAQGLELATPDGPRLVLLSGETRYQDEGGNSLEFGDLKRGDIVAVFGRFVQGDGGQLQAEFVVRLPPR